MKLLFKRVLNAADAPEAVEAENDDIDEYAAEASERIDEHVTSACVAANDGELMNFIERAINCREDDWVKDLSVFWKTNWMEALDEASAAVAEGAKEEKMSKLACDFVREAKECGKAGRLGVGSIAVTGRKGPDQNNEE